LRPGPERVFLGPNAVAHAGWDRPTVVAPLEPVALLVERPNSLRCEDRRGQAVLPAVDHQVEMNVAAISAGRRRVKMCDHVAFAYLLAFFDQQELLVKALRRFRAHRLNGIAEPALRTCLALCKDQIDAVAVVAARQPEPGVDAADHSIGHSVNGRVVA